MFEADRIRVTAPLPKWRKWLSAAVIAMGFTGLYHAASAQTHNKTVTPKPKSAVPDNDALLGIAMIDVSAEYPGGIERFYKYIAANVVPDTSCKPGEKAFLTFVIEKDGSITGVKIVSSPFSTQMNGQLIRMIEKSYRWKPAMQSGRVLRQTYTVPVTPVPLNNATK
jgi:hypothetical protein